MHYHDLLDDFFLYDDGLAGDLYFLNHLFDYFHGHFDRLDDLFFDDDGLAWDLYSLYHLFFDYDSLAGDLYFLHHLFNYFHGHFDRFDDLFFDDNCFAWDFYLPDDLFERLWSGRGRRSRGQWSAGLRLRAGERQRQDYHHSGDYQY